MLNMHLVLGLEQMHVLAAVGREIAYSPRAKYAVLIGGLSIVVVARGHDEARLGVLHLGSRQIGRVERRALDENDALRPDGHLQNHGQILIELAGREQHHVEVLEHGMRVELVEKVHDDVLLQRCGAHDHVTFGLCSLTRVRRATFLLLHVDQRQLLELEYTQTDIISSSMRLLYIQNEFSFYT